MTTPTPLCRRWFRYSLRMLFVVVTVLGVWLGVQVKWIRDRHEALEWLSQQGYLLHNSYTAAHTPDSPRILRLFGESGVKEIDLYAPKSIEQPAYHTDALIKLFPEANIYEQVPEKPGTYMVIRHQGNQT
jgi:hypothetical protein